MQLSLILDFPKAIFLKTPITLFWFSNVYVTMMQDFRMQEHYSYSTVTVQQLQSRKFPWFKLI